MKISCLKMTGLESILSIIKQDADEAVAGIIAEARAQAGEITEKAEAQGAFKAGDVSKAGEAQVQDILDRANSSAQHEARKRLLAAKQEIIRDVIEEARLKLISLEAKEYFEVLLMLVEKFSRGEDGIMELSAADLKRLPADFESRVNQRAKGKIQVSGRPAPVKNGFLLVYGGIDINCTFDALFEDSHEELQDKVSSILFA